jgi:pimeloyl-ACP methyl ester carboxylesterase
LLHGLSSAGVHFFPMLAYLRAHVSRLIIPDLPGHGFSDTPAPLDAATLHDGLFAALDQVTRSEPSLVFGNSLGGYWAVRYALSRPGRVRALLLASPGGAEMSELELAALRQAFVLTSHDQALQFIDRVLARRRWRRHVYAWGLLRQVRRGEVGEILRATTADQLLSPADLQRLTQPVLFVWGRAERLLPARHLEFWRQHLPAHAEIHEGAGWGHSPYLDDADAFARRLIQFARGV